MNRSKHIKVVELNITELCSRRCHFCPRHNSKLYKNQNLHMSRETFEYIVNGLQLSEYNGDICISGFSEPMMAKNIMYGLGLLSSKWKTKLITNCDFITVDVLKELNKFNLEEIKFDLYDSEIQYEKLLEMISDSNYLGKFNIRKVYEKKIENLNFYNRGGSAANVKSSCGIDPDRICNIPFYKVMIDWNGNYLLCHSDWHRQSEISKSNLNVKNYTLEQYLSSSQFNSFMDRMKKTKRRGLNPCETCDICGTLDGYIW